MRENAAYQNSTLIGLDRTILHEVILSLMRTPTIDELLDKVGSIYELAMLAAREARRISIKDRDEKEPLQRALERIAEGKVRGQYLAPDQMEKYLEKESERREAASVVRERVLSQQSDESKP
jgi:DNA-directed RNA polymerase omega subunit